jgi:glycosyltransferase involved in cell wall biosynthesis
MVLVLTPLGRGGAGGIDRLMDEVRRRHSEAAPDLSVRFLTTRGRGSILLAPFYVLWSALRLTGYRMARGPCVCHVNLASMGSTLRKLLLTRLAEGLGHATVIHLHGAMFRDYSRRVGTLQRNAIGRMFRKASRVIVLGGVWRDFVAETFAVPDARILVLPNASAARPRRAPEASPPEILFLGRLGTRKGVPVLIDALAQLARSRTDWRAVIAGDGDVTPYAAQAKALGLESRIVFAGWLEEDAAHAHLSRAAVLVLPSEAEGLPMSVVEAFAWGVPVVATPVGSIPDVLSDGVQGFIVPVGDDEALAAALERMLADPALRRRLGEEALSRFREKLDFEPYMRRLMDCWRDAVPRS